MRDKSKKQKAPKFLNPALVKALPTETPLDFLDFERRAAEHAARHEKLRYRIAPDCKVHISFDGIATQDAIRKLIKYLEMSIVDFPKNADDSPTQE